ncbi:MAG: gamma-glutamyl-gamma-aminobutyrate hydrolase family protein [Bryobacteraceae bacterium]
MATRAALTFRLETKAVPYVRALEAAGIVPIPITPGAPGGLEGLGGLVISGGTDLDPALYGQPRHAETEDPDTARDELELALLRAALDADLPVLAICRGMQLFNVALSGTLTQHVETISTHRPPRPPENELYRTAHDIAIVPGSRLHGITGVERKDVNSRHHQAVDRVAPGLFVSARANDGVVEAVELPTRRFALAVQWHPEDRIATDPTDLALFRAFAEELSR